MLVDFTLVEVVEGRQDVFFIRRAELASLDVRHVDRHTIVDSGRSGLIVIVKGYQDLHLVMTIEFGCVHFFFASLGEIVVKFPFVMVLLQSKISYSLSHPLLIVSVRFDGRAHADYGV